MLVRKTAIVIDDDEDTLDVVSELLQLNEIDVIGMGTDGKVAVDLYTHLRPDIAFLDVTMPKYDGIYALEHIREVDPGAKVIMITGDVTVATRKRLYDLGASNVFYKPLDMLKIIDAIHDVSAVRTDIMI